RRQSTQSNLISYFSLRLCGEASFGCGYAAMGNKAATFSFWDKVFRRAHSPPRRGGVSATSKKWIRSDWSRTGWSVRRPFERPAELTTPSAPPLWLRGIRHAGRLSGLARSHGVFGECAFESAELVR